MEFRPRRPTIQLVRASVDEDEAAIAETVLAQRDRDGTRGAIDLGEVAAETMALALAPFPRGPGADAALKQAGVLSEGEAGPFGALAGLLKKD